MGNLSRFGSTWLATDDKAPIVPENWTCSASNKVSDQLWPKWSIFQSKSQNRAKGRLDRGRKGNRWPETRNWTNGKVGSVSAVFLKYETNFDRVDDLLHVRYIYILSSLASLSLMCSSIALYAYHYPVTSHMQINTSLQLQRLLETFPGVFETFSFKKTKNIFNTDHTASTLGSWWYIGIFL